MSTQTTSYPQLSRTEWQAVSIALSDAADCRYAPVDRGPVGRSLSKLFHAVTGIERKTELADPRLETLRRFVCTTRRTRQVPEQLVPALIDQGFNHAQVDALALLAA